MRFKEKIQKLRRKYNYSQDYLAELCGVSRQAISKWEAGVSLPDIERYKLLSQIFNVSIDILIKDELSINDLIINTTCHKNAISNKSNSYFEGILIKESISDENVIDYLDINKVELWKTDDTPKYWTALYFTSTNRDLPSILAKVMISDENLGGNWFVDFTHENTKYIVFKDKILKYSIDNLKEKEEVSKQCKLLGIDLYESKK